MRDLRGLHDKVNTAGIQFVMCELELGITFYALGQATSDERSTRRNTTNAMNAYASAMRFVQRLVLTEDECTIFNRRKNSLEVLLGEFAPAV